MLFACLIDISIVPFYAYISLAAKTKQTTWTISLSDQSLLRIFTEVLFYAATVGGGLHLVSLVISGYLALTFRKITQLPPDMNPLEDNLASRHTRNKSSVSTFTAVGSPSERRLSRGSNLGDKRRSGAPYEDLDPPTTIPFLHTRTNSNESFQTNQSSPRTSRTHSPARYNAHKPGQSARHSFPDFKQAPSVSSSPKRASHHTYTAVSASEISQTAEGSISNSNNDSGGINWFTNDSLGKKGKRNSAPDSRPRSHQKPYTSNKSSYHPLPLDPSAVDDYDDNFLLPSPLIENPPTPRHNFPTSSSRYSSQTPSTITPENHEHSSSADITDESSGWPLPLRSPEIRELTPKPLRTRDSGSGDSFKSKYYGDLKSATPPIMVSGGRIERQVSSGTDFVGQGESYRRDVSGKIAEEGRGGEVRGARLRNVSGLHIL